MRTRKWHESEIKRAFDDFIAEHDRLPTKEEMYGKYTKKFPRPLSVKLAMGVTMGEYIRQNYSKYLNRCQSRLYGYKTSKQWVEDFKKQYLEYNKPIECEYNKLRRPGTPNTQTLAKIIGVVTWRELLEYCGFSINHHPSLSVQIDFEETIENYVRLNDKIQSLIKKQ